MTRVRAVPTALQLLRTYMDQIVRNAMETMGGGLYIQHTTAGRLFMTYVQSKDQGSLVDTGHTFSTQMTSAKIVAENRVNLHHMTDVLHSTCSKREMTISAEKSKVLSVGGLSVKVYRSCSEDNHQRRRTLFSTWEVSSAAAPEWRVKYVGVRIEKARKVYQIPRHRVFCSRNLRISTIAKSSALWLCLSYCMVLKCG